MSWDARLEIKLDKIVDRIGRVDVTLAEQHVSLKEHMKRSDALEKQIAALEKEIKPVQKHVYMVGGAFKLLGSVSVVLGLLKYALKLI